MSHSHPVRYEKDGGVVVLTLNEPTTRNAISPAIVQALVECTERVNADLSVGCVILTGAGKGFSSGGNVKQMKGRAVESRQDESKSQGWAGQMGCS